MKIKIGGMNTLKILRSSHQGVYLGLEGSEDTEEILLPNRYVPPAAEVGDLLEVFVLYDSEDRLIATTEEPFAKVGEFAHLKVIATEKVGAFLSWGMPKDLLLPFAEQTRTLRVGDFVVVFLYLDNSHRIAASMRLEKRLESKGNYKEGEAVNLFIVAETDLGFKAIINDKHIGVLYANEVFQPLKHGQRIKGFVKKPRDDGKIDLILDQVGYKASGDIGEKILELLKKENGFLPLTDKTPPETIYKMFGVSKKKYKIALGALYKKRLISVEEGGIKLCPQKIKS